MTKNSGTPKNIKSLFSNLFSSKLFKLIYSKLTQESNIFPISVTFEVLKLDKSNELSFNLPNIEFILITFSVLK